MIFQELAYHLWLHFAILYEKLKQSWENWEKEIRKIFEIPNPLISPERFKDLYQEYPLSRHSRHPYF